MTKGENQASSVLTEIVMRGNAVLVLGAGVTAASIGSGHPCATWTSLLLKGLEDCENREGVDLQKWDQCLEALDSKPSTDTYLEVAAFIKRSLGGDFGRWVTSVFENLEPQSSELIRAIGNLGLPIFTVNYDMVTESVLGRGSAVWSDQGAMRAIATGKSNKIGHFHGIWTEPTSMAFDEESYEKLSSTGSRTYASQIASTHTMVFLGFGNSMDDPHFSKIVDDFKRDYPNNRGGHFRMCLSSDAKNDPLAVISDVSYGDSFDDLPAVIESVGGASRELTPAERSLMRRINDVSQDLCESVITLGDRTDLTKVTYADLIVDPVFLPESHERFHNALVSGSTARKPSTRAEPYTLEDLIGERGQIVLVAGPEGSGVSTASGWLTLQACERYENVIPLRVYDPLRKTNQHPVQSIVDREIGRLKSDTGEAWTVDRMVVLADPFTRAETKSYRRSLVDIAENEFALAIVGVPEEDALSIKKDLEECNPDRDIKIAYLGRFGESEVDQLIEKMTGERNRDLARKAVAFMKNNSLPRTPVVCALVVQSIQQGAIDGAATEFRLLESYLEQILQDGHGAVSPVLGRNETLTLLKMMAAQFVKERLSQMSEGKLCTWIENQIKSMQWEPRSASSIIDFYVSRHVLKKRDGDVLFQRGIYQTVLAAREAADESDFYQFILDNPLEMAPVIKAYADYSRRKEEVLQTAVDQLDKIGIPPEGSTVLKRFTPFIFPGQRRKRKVPAPPLR